MKTQHSSLKRGFTLLETVIAIGVLAVLLTGFIIVFAPAAAGIKKAINVQEADRLASTVEQELVTWRTGDPGTTGFEKAFDWIKKGESANTALLVYQYRGSLTSLRPDGTPVPVETVTDKLPGKDYKVQSMVRQKDDTDFTEDLKAVEGAVYLVKCTQLIFKNSQMELGTAGQIQNPKTPGGDLDVTTYPEAVVAFSAEFYSLPAKSAGYFTSRFPNAFTKFKNPVFTRNLAVRR